VRCKLHWRHDLLLTHDDRDFLGRPTPSRAVYWNDRQPLSSMSWIMSSR